MNPPIPLSDAVRSVRSGERAALDLCSTVISTIRESEAGAAALNAFLAVAGDGVLADAQSVDAAIAAGETRELPGAVIAVKDNICTADLPTTCGSRILEGYHSPYEATVIRRIRAAGGVIAGKTNLDEFAMGSSTENSAWGATRNPVDRARVPGGSSGGSAAAVAAGLVHAALGSDTGGSVRQPAAFCGVVGVKPTYGRVSRYGLVAFGSSLDQIGTLTHTVQDAALLLGVIAGHDPLDSTSSVAPVPDFAAECERDVGGLVIGVPAEYFGEGLDPLVGDACERALARLEAAGARLREIRLPHTRYAIPVYYLIAPAEASSNLARYDGIRFGRRPDGARTAGEVYERTRGVGFGAEVKRRIMLGTFALSAGYHDQYYGRAQRMRRRIASELRAAFAGGIDAIFTPTTPAPAFRIGEKRDDPYAMYLSDVYTVTANLAGLPAASVPIGFAHGLPVGGQIMCDLWRDDLVIRFSAALERAVRA